MQQQARLRQEQQQAMLRQVPMQGGVPNYPNMIRGYQANGIAMNPNDLQRKALQNTRNAYVQPFQQFQT